MKRTLSALVVSSVVIGGGFAVPSVASAHGERADHFTLTADITAVEHEDHGHEGPSKGDVYTFEYDLADHDGADAGTGASVCELVEVDRHDHEWKADCEGTLDLDGGQLELEGTVTDEDMDAGEAVLDVVGGTGDYEDAAGTATVAHLGEHHGDGGHMHAQHAGHPAPAEPAAPGDHADHADHGDHGDHGPDLLITVDLD